MENNNIIGNDLIANIFRELNGNTHNNNTFQDSMYASVEADGTLGIGASAAIDTNRSRSLASIIEERSVTIKAIARRDTESEYDTIRGELVRFIDELQEANAAFLQNAGIPESVRTVGTYAAAEEENMQATIQAINVTLENAVDPADDAFTRFRKQCLLFLSKYKNTGKDLIRQEKDISQKLKVFDDLAAKLKMLTDLPYASSLVDTPEITNLLKSYRDTLKMISDKLKFNEEYTSFMEKHREWSIVRDLLMLHRVAVADGHTGPTCSVCIEDPVTLALVPCGHTYCISCKQQMGRNCPLCRQQIKSTIRVFFS